GSLDEVAAVDIAIRRYYEKGGSGRVLGEGHRVAEGSHALGVIAREAIRVEAIEVAAAQLAIRLAVAEHVVGDHKDAVGDGDDGLLVAAPLDEAPVLRREVAVARADGASGALDERRAQRPVGEASAAAQALAGALVVARAEAGPRGRMTRGREARHVAAEFGRDDLGRPARDAGNRVEPGERIGVRRGEGLDMAGGGAAGAPWGTAR